MKIIRDYKNCPDSAKGSLLAIGNFDGMHKGHIAVINKAKEIAKIEGVQTSVLTFEPHPLKILRPGAAPFRLMTESQKSEFMEGLGVQNLFVIDFDHEFSQITAEKFIQEILVKGFAVKHVVTGAGFLFGYEREGNTDTLAAAAKDLNFGYTKIMPVGGGSKIFSSSYIRRALEEGALDIVKSMLGRNFIIQGVVEGGNKQGNIIGFPTANLDLGKYIRPAFGVYAVKIYINGQKEALRGVANIGVRPTLGYTKELLEAHIFDFYGNIYGKKVAIELIEYIRPEQKFKNLEELKLQIAQDCIKVRKIFV